MLVSRLWRRAVIRRLFQQSRFLSHEQTSHAVFSSKSSHRERFFAGRNPWGLFAERDSGFGRLIPALARPCSADDRRCFCTSEAPIVDGNVGTSDIQPDDDISAWEEQIRPYVRKYANSQRAVPLLRQDFTSVRKAAQATGAECSNSVLHHNDGVVDCINESLLPHQNSMGASVANSALSQTDKEWQATAMAGGLDAETPFVYRCNNGMGECFSSENPEDSDNEGDEKIPLPGPTVQSKEYNVLTPADKETVEAICEVLNSNGWTASTKMTLEKKYSQSLSPAIMSAVILQQKNVAMATSFFQWACEQKGHISRIYNAYLVRLGETRHFEEMWALVDKMKENGLELGERTFSLMIRACGVAGMPAMAVDAFKRAHEYGLMASTQLPRALLTMFFQSNLADDAKIFYSIMIQESLPFDTHTYNTLMNGFNLFSTMEDTESSFKTMLEEGQEPNILSYNGLIEAYCSVHAIEKAMSAFSDLQRRGLKPTATTLNLLLSALCSMRRIDDAISLFASMNTVCNPNRSTFNILLHGLLVCKEVSKAISLFSFMEKEGLTNQATFTHLASGLRTSKQIKKAAELLKALVAKHGYAIRCVCTALLDSFCRSGELNEAESLFNGMLESSEEPYVSWFAIMISLYSRLGMLDRAFELLSELQGKGLRPTVFCYLPLIAALLKADRVANALKCFQEMLEHKHDLNAFTCDYLLRELCKHGMVDDALHVFDVILRNKFSILKPTLKELMKCLCKLGKIEEASSCFRALHNLHCLPLRRAAALQALSVMDVMSCASNEKDRVSTCVAL